MAEVKWTPAQERAITSRGNVLVSAAAGSGKTATLSAKIMNLLRTVPDVSLGEFLIVTFTNAAAAELKERIGREITKASLEDRSMLRHKRDVSGADICTIHSFCMKLIRRYFSVLDVPPDFGIVDDVTAKTMKARSMESVVDDYFKGELIVSSSDCADIFTLADAIGATKDAAGLDRSLRDLVKEMDSMGYDESKLAEYASELDRCASLEFFDTSFGKVIKNEFVSTAEHYLKMLTSVMREMAYSAVVTEKYMPAAAALKDYLERIVSCSGGYGDMRAVVAAYEAVPLSNLSAKDKTDAAKEFAELRKEIAPIITKLAEKYFTHPDESVAESFKRTARILRTCSEVIGQYRARYNGMKRERGVLDFADLEELALKLLENPDGTPTREALEAGAAYRFVFIDEYQDTNHVQDRIFRAISGNAERFFVGDIKQSIYGFRGAEPEVFSGYRNAWNEDENDLTVTDGYPLGHSIFMSENFRCAKPVIEFANTVSRYMFPYGGIPFSESDCLRYGGVAVGDEPVEVCLIDGSRNTKGSTEVTVPEAEYVAYRAYRLIKDEGYKPSDIAIILRDANISGGDYEAALKEKGIPVRRVDGSAFADEPEVILCLNILRAVDNPMRDVSLAGAMFSSVFGFTMEDLTLLRLRDDRCPLYTSVLTMAEDTSPLGDKCRAFVDQLSELRRAERGMSADRFIEYAYSYLNLFDAPEIKERLFGETHLRMLHELARKYESGIFGGLYGFLSYIDEQLEVGNLTTEGKNDENGVTIVSIHKSKGLEYRLCFLSGFGKHKSSRDERGNVLFDKELGIGMRLPDEGGLVLCGNLVRDAICAKKTWEASREEMRTLYVAMTRAKERLIITAKTSVKPEQELKRAESLRKYVDEYMVLSAQRMLDTVLRALADDTSCEVKYTVVPKDTDVDVTYELILDKTENDFSVTPEELEAVRENIAFVYPREHMVDIPSKLSVSALYPSILDDDEETVVMMADSEAEFDEESAVRVREEMPRPRFMMGDAAATGADRGTATHVFLQFADFSRLRSEGVRSELARLTENGFITREMAELVNRAQVAHFAESDFMTRILTSERVMREFRFNVLLPAENFTEDDVLKAKLAEGDETVTVQGVFDCVFIDGNGSLVLIDYKTDYITSEELVNRESAYKKLRDRHSRQLGYYKEAVKLIFGRYPDETYIYSLPLGETVEI